MPVNPFGQDDPLAPGGGGAWGAGAGAGAGGFGQASKGEAYAATDGEFDVVDIAEPTATATPAKANGAAAKPVAAASVSDKSLAQREADLAKREAALKRREAAIAAGGPAANLTIKNWPPCFPMVHNDIGNDIPEGKRGITRAGFFIFNLTALTLLWNFVAVLIAALAASEMDGSIASSIVFAIIYVLVGVPGAWVTWYQRLYRAMMYDGATSFATFFFFFLIHIAFAVWSGLSPGVVGQVNSNYAHAGLFPMLEFFKASGAGNRIAGILYLVGTIMWGLTAALSILFLGRVYKFFRTSGAEERARDEVRAGAARQAVQLARA